MKFSFNSIDVLSPDEFEEFVMDCFQSAGWKQLRRTQVGIDSRYGDGGYDIEGWREDRKWLIEVKQRSNSNVGIDALRQIESAGRKYNSKNLILVTNQDFSSVVHDEAAKLGIELFNRNKLLNLYLQGSTDVGKRIKLRVYQQNVVKSFEEKFSKFGQRKFLLEMATGLGKTVTSSALVERMIKLEGLKKPRVLFVVHQKEIVKQSRESYKSYLGFTKYSYSALFDGDEVKDHDFVFATFQTMLMQKRLPQDYFDIIVVDEAHHFAASSFSKLDTMFSPRFMLGLTATPERTDGKDIFSFFGGRSSILGELNLAWALKNKHLAIPKYHVLTDDIDETKLASLKNGLTRSELDKTLFLQKRDDEVYSIIDSQLKSAGVSKPKVIVFCKSIRHIENFMNCLPPGTATYIHSKMSRDAQNFAISNFREGEFQFILTVDMFNEGVDIPEVNAIVFLRSTSSRTVWLQQLGRGLRKTDNKNYVEVFDFVGSVGRILEVENLKRDVENSLVDKNPRSSKEKEDDVDDEIVLDADLDVKYSKYAAEVQKLLEQYQFKINSRKDCVEEINRIYTQIKKIPTIHDLINEIQLVSIDQIVTIFGDYWSLISVVFSDEPSISIIRLEIEEAIVVRAKEQYKVTGLLPSSELLQCLTSSCELPLTSLKHIKQIIETCDIIHEKVELVSGEVATGAPMIGTHGTQICSKDKLEYYKNIIFSIEDIKKLSGDERRAIRKLFGLDVDFLKALDLIRENEKAS